jgi:4'-phosphopantetheinyl transferase
MIEWMPSDGSVGLASNEIRVYRCSLDTNPEELTALARTLTPEEQERASRFFFSQDRDHFVKGRATLRSILGKFLRAAPEEVPLRRGKYGKLHLDAQEELPLLHFNLAHSHGLILYAFSFNSELGIDLEKIRADRTLVASVSEFFAPAERGLIDQRLQCGQFDLFYRCWVMKEAYTKARGEGLQVPLNSFELPPAWPDSEWANPLQFEGWAIAPFHPAPGYIAALSSKQRSHAEVRFQDWLG